MSDIFRIKGQAWYFDPAVRGSMDGQKYELKLVKLSEETVKILADNGVTANDGNKPNKNGKLYPDMARWVSLKSKFPFVIKDAKKNDFDIHSAGIGNGSDLVVVCGTYPDALNASKFYPAPKIVQIINLVEYGGADFSGMLEEEDGYEVSASQAAQAADRKDAEDLLDDEIPF